MDVLFAALTGLVLYAYVGYPALLWLLTRFRPAPEPAPRPPEPDGWPAVSVMLPAHNEEAVIGRRLDNLLALDYPPDRLEIVCGSDASDDGTVSILRQRRDARLQVIESRERRGKTALLNEMVRASRGELIAFTDANCAWDRDALRHLAAPFADPGVGCVIGELVYVNVDQPTVKGGEGLYWRLENAIKEMESRLQGTLVANGSIYALRRELFRPLPGEISDDSVNPLLVLRAGKRVLFERRAVAREKAAARLAEEFRRKARMVTRQLGSHRFVRAFLWPPRPLLAFRLASHKLVRWLVPLFVAGAVAVAAVESHRPFYQAVLVLSLAGTLAFLAAGWRLRAGAGVPRLLRLWVYLWMVNLAAVRGLWDFAIGRRRAVWRVSESTR